MEKEEFSKTIIKQAEEINIKLSQIQVERFYCYMKQLISWNQKINLTAITEESEIIEKHFIDSLTINKYIDKDAKLIDVGTGAGFPGVPIKIVRDDIEITLLDALNKRLNFLNEIINENKLEGINTVHYRAEEAGKIKDYREKFDIATSRAVAQLNILTEYLLPFVKIGGKCICMKGSNIKEELERSKKSIEILGGRIEAVDEFYLPNSDISRSIIVIKKIKTTPAKYPRKAGTPGKEPII